VLIIKLRRKEEKKKRRKEEKKKRRKEEKKKRRKGSIANTKPQHFIFFITYE
jgi:hypothetical protein